tara:strand:- start:289 stop:492 length:204 start_codon:yes stop_codon:yes gene_type:complete
MDKSQSQKPTNKELIEDIKDMLKDITRETKTIKDDIHYIKISILSGKKLIEDKQPKTEPVSAGWWWS